MNTTDDNASNIVVDYTNTNDKLDKLIKVINDMKSILNKLIASFNCLRDEQKILRQKSLILKVN